MTIRTARLMLLCSFILSESIRADPPNILLIMADDLGAENLACYGNTVYSTPNLDRMATEGARFDSAYATPVCTPTRAMILTGLYPNRSGFLERLDSPDDVEKNNRLPVHLKTFGHVFQSAGYRTAIAGKWHLGDFQKYPDQPTSHGFDEHCLWVQYWNGERRSRYYGPHNWENGKYKVHGEEAFERVMKALKAKGLDENTLVLFSSDHGPAPYAGNILKATPAQIHQLEAMGHYPSGPHRGYKFSAYEGGLRVPLIARWPGVIPEGQTCDALVGLNDLFATFADLANSRVNDDEGPDSISFGNLLRNPKAEGTRQDLVMQSVVSFVVRDGKWKLCLCPGSGTVANSENAAGSDPMPNEAWRKALDQFEGKPANPDLLRTPFVQLFDLAKDPHEDKNLAAVHPERVEQMVAVLQEQIANGRSTPGPKLKNDKNVKAVNINDKRLPTSVRERLN